MVRHQLLLIDLYPRPLIVLQSDLATFSADPHCYHQAMDWCTFNPVTQPFVYQPERTSIPSRLPL